MGKPMSTAIENRVWTDIQQAVRKRLSSQSFDTWIRPIQFNGCDQSEQVLHLRAPNLIVKDWVSSNFSDVIDASLKELNLATYHIDWTVEQEAITQPEIEERRDNKEEDSFGLKESADNNGQNQSSSLFSLLEAAESDGLAPSATKFVDIEPLDLSLNPKCSLRPCRRLLHQFAHAAAQAVAELRGKLTTRSTSTAVWASARPT